MKKIFQKYLANEWIIALAVFLIVFPFLPSISSKYQFKIESTREITPAKGRLYYEDLDDDGESERFVVAENMWGNLSFVMENSKGDPLNQWNMDFPSLNSTKDVFFEDLDGDHQKEVVLFSHKGDSIMMHIASFLNTSKEKIQSFYVDRIGNYNPSVDYSMTHDVAVSSLFQVTIKGEGYVFFSITTGFAGYPRNVYRMKLSSGNLIKSEHLGNRIGITSIADLDADGRPEIILSTNSASNNKWFDDSYYKRSDESSWQIVLNDDLSFDFPPIEIPSEFSVVTQDTIRNKGDLELLTVSIKKKQIDGRSKLFLKSYSALKTDSIILPENKGKLLPNPNTERIWIYGSNSGTIYSYDYSLSLRNRHSLSKSSIIYSVDYDKDSKNEWLTVDPTLGELVFWSNDFKKRTSLFIPELIKSIPRDINLKYRGENPFVWFQLSNKEYEVSYGPNPTYWFNWLAYPVIYLLFVLAIWFAMRIQRIKEQKNREIENKISDLQYKAIKNQLDPHFVFNSINTIAEMKINDKLEVDQFICEFSDLMRKTITHSEHIIHSLGEELSYVKNYVRLQAISHEGGFTAEYHVQADSLLRLQVPKHILYTYVENAIKHGFYQLETPGLLKVQILNGAIDDEVILKIENSGNSGLQRQKANKIRSTGSGLKIMDEIFALYEERYGKSIEVKSEVITQNKESNESSYVVTIQINPIS